MRTILVRPTVKPKLSSTSCRAASMEQAKNVATGFTLTASAICLLITFAKMTTYWSLWLGGLLLLALAVPFFVSCFIKAKGFQQKQTAQIRVKQAKNFLMGIQGVGFACWFFDVTSTIFNIDINRNSMEMNPLGWPYSAPAALAFYVPITFVAYFLLFKMKSKASFYGAVAVSVLSLFMAVRNFGASLSNFSSLRSASPAADLEILFIWGTIVVVLAGLNLGAILKTRRHKAS